jgi:hypothetical protein
VGFTLLVGVRVVEQLEDALNAGAMKLEIMATARRGTSGSAIMLMSEDPN